MSRTKRLVIGFGVIELILAGLWVWLAQLAATRPGTDPDAQEVIGRIMGGAMGGIFGLGLVLYLVMKLAGPGHANCANRTMAATRPWPRGFRLPYPTVRLSRRRSDDGW